MKRYCTKCNKEIKETAKFCPYCGITIQFQTQMLKDSLPNQINQQPVKGTPQLQGIYRKSIIKKWWFWLIIVAMLTIVTFATIFILDKTNNPIIEESQSEETDELNSEEYSFSVDPSNGDVFVILEVDADFSDIELNNVLDNSISIMSSRLQELGLPSNSYSVQKDIDYSEKAIRLDLYGIEKPSEIIDFVTITGRLRICTADGESVLDSNQIIGSSITTNNQTGYYSVILNIDDAGKEAIYDATKKASEEEISQEKIKRDEFGSIWVDEKGNPIDNNQLVILLDDSIISAPKVFSPIESNEIGIYFIDFSQKEATLMAAMFRGGVLPGGMIEVASGSPN